MQNRPAETRNPYHDHKLFWHYHLERAGLLLAGQIPPPSLVEIDPTDGGCNQNCIFCCFHSGPHRKLISADVPMLLSFLAEAYAHGTYAFELVGGGEPTNHKNVASLIAGIAALVQPEKERSHIGLVTNGVRLERIFAVAHLLDFVRVSLDSAYPPTYSLLHGVPQNANHFERVTGNIRRLVELIGTEKVRVGYLVVPPHNHSENQIAKAAEMAFQMKVQHIAFRPVSGGPNAKPGMWLEALRAINALKGIYPNGFILGGEGGFWPHVSNAQNQPTGLCRTRPLVLTIKANGTIPSCFLYRERLAERPALGHISQGFRHIWFSEAHEQSLRAVRRETCPAACKLYRADAALQILQDAAASPVPSLTDAELDNPHFV